MINQIGMTVTGFISIWCFSSLRHHKWGFISGIIGQPFWIYMCVTTGQYGLLLLSLWYTGCHIRGINNYFLRKRGRGHEVTSMEKS